MARLSGLATRPPIDRMQRIFQEIRSGSFPSRAQLAVDLEVTTKTIQRDLDFMRDRLRLPIAFAREQGGYTFTEEVTSFPLLELSEAEIVSVFVAQKALQAYQGTAFEEPLRSAYSKLVGAMNGRVSVPWSDLGNGVSFRTYQARRPELACFEAAGEAVRQSRRLRFQYRKLDAEKPERRIVEPYHLTNIHGQWYVIAHDPQRRGWRNFALCRMKDATVLADAFARDRAFDVNEYLGRSLGIFRGDGNHVVRLRFDAWAAQLVRERAWHPRQKLADREGGGMELSLELSSLEEVLPWVLSWGDHVEVIAPAELKKRVRAIARAILSGPGE